MSAVLKATPDEVHFELFDTAAIGAVLAVETRAYAFPWSHGNFVDALASGYQAQLLKAGDQLLGYFIAMQGVDEVHLLNITVAPEHQRQGWARLMLEALTIWSRAQAAEWLWLEVRQSNTRAMQVYEGSGFRRVGHRAGYYPNGARQRDDAIVMSLKL